jgi:hypothetical protein
MADLRQILPRLTVGSRLRKEWAVRALVGLTLAVLGFLSINFTTAQLLRRSSPETAYRLAPYDGRVSAAYAAASPSERSIADRLASDALHHEATAVTAAAVLGLNAQIRGDAATARRQMAYAQLLSRRDIRVQLWSIEDAADRGDVQAALKWYDITLRVKPDMATLLYPLLTSAASEGPVRSVLVDTLATRPMWGEGFIKFAAGRGADPRLTAVLFRELAHRHVPIPTSAQAGLIDALLRQSLSEPAWSFYKSLHPQADRRRSRDANFSAEIDFPTQFDWVPVADGEATTSLQSGGFDFSAPPSISGMLLWQRQVLPAGRYRLRGETADIDQPSGSRPYWALTCNDDHELMRFDLSNSSQNGGRFAIDFEVPEQCPIQRLSLNARATNSVNGLAGRIVRAELAPVTAISRS